MADNRLTREIENRDATKRTAEWSPPALLPEPNPVPGWKFKYIRISVMGQNDPTNVSSMFREGWEPVKASEVPEIMYQADNNPTSRYKDCVEIGGLLLCKMPEETVNARRKYYENMNRAQMEGVDNTFLRQNDPRMPMERLGPAIERKTQTTFGSGKR